MKNFREIENLSAYLDGQLNTSDAAQVEVRLKTDPELASVMNDLRAARGILRKLPARKAPRNFTLTRKMVGLKPPLPRTYPLFRFATAFATILFVMSLSVNMMSPFVSFGAPAAPAAVFGSGGGNDAATEEAFMQAAEPVTEEPSAMAESAPVATETARIAETPATKEGESEAAAQDQAPETANQAPVEEEAPAPFTPFNWTFLFLIISVIGGVILWVMRLIAQNKWR